MVLKVLLAFPLPLDVMIFTKEMSNRRAPWVTLAWHAQGPRLCPSIHKPGTVTHASNLVILSLGGVEAGGEGGEREMCTRNLWSILRILEN